VCPLSRLYHVSTARRISLGCEGNVLYPVLSSYLRRRLVSEDIVCVSVCVSAALRIVSARRAAAACHSSLGGEGNALLLSVLLLFFIFIDLIASSS